MDLAVNLLSDLSKLKLSPKDLVLFLLKRSFSLLKSSLELLLLNLQAAALLVKLMDGAATITQLVKEILDLISKVLVLALDNVELLKGLILREGKGLLGDQIIHSYWIKVNLSCIG